MRRLLILGAGAAGTTVANKLRRRLGARDWTITVVDRGRTSLHQPALLALPFGEAGSENLFRLHSKQLRRGISLVVGDVGQLVPHTHHVLLTDGRRLDFDYVVIATGAAPRLDAIPGLVGPQWRLTIHEYFTAGGAIALRNALHRLGQAGGRLVLQAGGARADDFARPLEFLAKADSYLRVRGVRDSVELVCALSLDTARSGLAGHRLEQELSRHKVVLESGFVAARVEPDRRVIVAEDGRTLPFDLLVTSPAPTGADFVGRSRLGDDRNFIAVHPETARSQAHADIFAVGSAALPAGDGAPGISAAAFADVFVRLAAGQPPAGGPDRSRPLRWLRWRSPMPIAESTADSQREDDVHALIDR